MKKISVTDITLNKLAGERGVSLLFREKTAIAAGADALGATAIELAPVASVREDTIVYKTISQNIKNGSVAIPVGFSTDSVAVAWECIKEAVSPRLQVVVPTSTVQMEYIHHMKAEKMLAKIAELTAEAKKFCDDVEFVALDATRADADFLMQAIKTAEENGAKIVTVCDDAGISLPEEIAELTKKVKSVVGADVYIQPSDRISMATAAAIAAITAGADGIKCAISGKDVLLVGSLSDAISARGESLGITVSIDTTKIHSGVDGMLETISHESYSAEPVDEKNGIILDADSTISDVAQAASLLGYDLSDEDNGNVHRALVSVCQKKNSVGAKELEALIASAAMQAPSTYHFESYTTNCTNLGASMSQVTLNCGGETLCGVATGDGPIDSAFRAIEQSIGYHYELDDFQIQAVTEGKEALGSALVKLRVGGKLYSGNGISTDIVAASIRAYINALNKIVAEER
ncbi:MAG: hypothetical protein IJ299_00620 [Oscillospiraceae bacterium]|nr:hypothetical protein [Oscillospiraceae bacterium]